MWRIRSYRVSVQRMDAPKTPRMAFRQGWDAGVHSDRTVDFRERLLDGPPGEPGVCDVQQGVMFNWLLRKIRDEGYKRVLAGES